MKLTFREYLEESRLIESFDRNPDYKRLSKSDELKYYCKYFDDKSSDYVKSLISQLSFFEKLLFKK